MALANLADNAANQVAIAEQGGIAAVIGAMGRFKGSEDVQKQGCMALKSLAGNGKKRREVKFDKKGYLNPVMFSMFSRPFTSPERLSSHHILPLSSSSGAGRGYLLAAFHCAILFVCVGFPALPRWWRESAIFGVSSSS